MFFLITAYRLVGLEAALIGFFPFFLYAAAHLWRSQSLVVLPFIFNTTSSGVCFLWIAKRFFFAFSSGTLNSPEYSHLSTNRVFSYSVICLSSDSLCFWTEVYFFPLPFLALPDRSLRSARSVLAWSLAHLCST